MQQLFKRMLSVLLAVAVLLSLTVTAFAADDGADANGGLFGLGKPNTAYAQYFTGESFLNPLTDPTKTVFLANVTFSPACRNN